MTEIELHKSEPAAIRIGGPILLRVSRWSASRLRLQILHPRTVPVARESLGPEQPGRHD